jgi:hypothetical protein
MLSGSAEAELRGSRHGRDSTVWRGSRPTVGVAADSNDWGSNALYPAHQSSMWMEFAIDACESTVISSDVLPHNAKWKD